VPARPPAPRSSPSLAALPPSCGRDEFGRIYRRISHGPLLDLFILDMRTYKDPNGPDVYADPSIGMLGPAQRAWLKRELAASKATWKVIANDLPLGLVVPARAAIGDFTPFWEFVAGPLNAGAFRPNALDATFGPQTVFSAAPPVANTSPADGLQFFGYVTIDGHTEVMTVSLRDLDGKELFSVELTP
jgi:alkaline phosphatase D